MMLTAAATGSQNATSLADEYKSMPGRELFDEQSITGLNKVPVTVLAGYILAGARVADPAALPMPVEQLVQTLLVDGSLFIAPAVDDSEVCGLIDSGPDVVVQVVEAGEGYAEQEYTRVWTRADSVWLVVDYDHYGTKQQAEVNRGRVADNLVQYHYNAAAPAGILYPAQRTYRRIEEIAGTIRRLQQGANAKTIFGGHLRNQPMAEAELNDENKDYAFMPGDLRIDRATTTAAIDQRMTEINWLTPLYLQQTHMVDTTSPVQRPSGADRALVLGPMLRFVDAMRDQVSAVVAECGTAWEYERVHTTDVNERTAEYMLLVQLRDAGVITEAIFNTKAGQLV